MLDRAKICLVLTLIIVCTSAVPFAAGSWGGIISTENNIYLIKDKVIIVKISGQSTLEKHQDVTITVRHQDDSIPIQIPTKSENDGSFQNVFRLDQRSQHGTYYVTGSTENGRLEQVAFRVINPNNEYSAETPIQPPVSSNSYPCVGTEKAKVIGLDIACVKIFDKNYECPDGEYLDFTPKPPVCRDKQNNEISRDALLKPIPAPSPGVSSEESRSPDDSADRPSLFDICNNSQEWHCSDPYRYIIAAFVVAGIVSGVFAISRKRKKSKNDINQENDDKTEDSITHDSKIPTQGPEPAMDPTSDTAGEQSKSMQEDISADKNPSSNVYTTAKSTTGDGFDDSKSSDIRNEHWNLQITIIDTNILHDYAEYERNPEENSHRAELLKQRYKKVQEYIRPKIKKKVLYVPSEVIQEFNKEIKRMDPYTKDDVETRISFIKEYYDVDVRVPLWADGRYYNKIPEKLKSSKWISKQEKIIKKINSFYRKIYNSKDGEAYAEEKKEWLKVKMEHPNIRNAEKYTENEIRQIILERLINPDPNSKKDRRMLAKAIRLKEVNDEKRKIVFFTNDSDFTAFGKLIENEFGITIEAPRDL